MCNNLRVKKHIIIKKGVTRVKFLDFEAENQSLMKFRISN